MEVGDEHYSVIYHDWSTSLYGEATSFIYMDDEVLNAYRQSKYAKPYFFVDDQLAKLRTDGLVIQNYEAARSMLRESGYYRFTGYAYYFKRDDGFPPGTTFSQIADLYKFDESVRKKFVEGLEMIEVWLRSQLSNRLGFYHPFAHRIPTYLRKNSSVWVAGSLSIKQSEHIAWVADYSREERRSQGDFVKHFRRKYGPHLPVWAATEIMTMGTLRRLFDLLHEEDAALIAARAGVTLKNGKGDHRTFSRWLDHFRYLRNVCAHYGRVWNKVFDTSLAAPKEHIKELSHLKGLPHKPYKTIAVMRFLFARIYPSSSWSEEMVTLLQGFLRRSGIPLVAMGFPGDWDEEWLWRRSYEPDLQNCNVIDHINQIECVTQPKLLETIFPKRNEREKKDFLRYLVKNKGIFIHETGETKYYPTFQFNEALTDVDCNVGDVNEVLIDKFDGQPHVAQAVQQWWVTGDLGPTAEGSPITEVKRRPDFVLQGAARLAPFQSGR